MTYSLSCGFCSFVGDQLTVFVWGLLLGWVVLFVCSFTSTTTLIAADLEEVLKPGSFSLHVLQSIWLYDICGQRPWRAWPMFSTILVSQSPDADEGLALSTLLRTYVHVTQTFSVSPQVLETGRCILGAENAGKPLPLAISATCPRSSPQLSPARLPAVLSPPLPPLPTKTLW